MELDDFDEIMINLNQEELSKSSEIDEEIIYYSNISICLNIEDSRFKIN